MDQSKGYADTTTPVGELGPFAPFIPDIDILLCADMGTEPAGFILSSLTKLIYVHVKCGSIQNPQSSADALAEVCSQAVKSLEMLITNDHRLSPVNRNTILREWPSNAAPNCLNERIMLNNRERFVNSTGCEQLRENKFSGL